MQNRLIVPAIVLIALQCIVIFLISTRISFFIGDDLAAVELMHQVDFWSYLAAPVDIHRIPLHRLVNYLLHTLFPMNFSVATAFMIASHAATLFVLYKLLQRLNPSRLNIVLILACALNVYVYFVMHWWSAALHRLPYILAAVISCYGFWRFHEERRLRFAVLAIASQVIGVGFFVKAVLIPGYWAALLFCTMDFRGWKKYWRDYLLLGCGLALSLAYAAWYMHDNPYDVIQTSSSSQIIWTSLLWGFSSIAHMPLQMLLNPSLAPWINTITCLTLIGAIIVAPRTWRVVLMVVLALSVNLLIIAASSRATLFGALVILTPYYYAELLFLLAIFTTLLWRPVREKMRARNTSAQSQSLPLSRGIVSLLMIGSVIYAAAGWHTVWNHIKPGANEDHWKSARFARNLRHDMAVADITGLNLIDRALPDEFRFGMLLRRPLPTSTFLSWFGWKPLFQQADTPLSYIDTSGHLQNVATTSKSIAMHAATASAENCHDNTAPELLYTLPSPLALEHGYLLIDYDATHDIQAQALLQGTGASLGPATLNLVANQKRLWIDLSYFHQFQPAEITGLKLTQPGAGICIRNIHVTPY